MNAKGKTKGGLQVAGRRRVAVVLFCAIVFLSAAILFMLRTRPAPAPLSSAELKTDTGRATAPAQARTEKSKVDPLLTAPPPRMAAPPEETNSVKDADLDYLAARNLLIPAANVTASQLRDTYIQARSEGRRHDAIDITAPQGTPVVATADGKVIKLFLSDKGGVTLYELDPSERYVYYYAHLMRYAEGVVEGKQLRRGDVIAYVGDTGNAGSGNYHLHFAISKISSPRQWSGGDPINPYPLLVRK